MTNRIGSCAFVLVLATGCGDGGSSDTAGTTPGTAGASASGSGGTSASGGKSASAGASGTTGKGGASGVGGGGASAGIGGTAGKGAAAGRGGASGTAGTAGAGGGGAGGKAGAGGGAGGKAGAGGGGAGGAGNGGASGKGGNAGSGGASGNSGSGGASGNAGSGSGGSGGSGGASGSGGSGGAAGGGGDAGNGGSGGDAGSGGSAGGPTGGAMVAYQVDVAHAGSITVGLTASPVKKWSVSLAGSISYPLVVDDRVFVTYAKPAGVGTALVALSAQTGATLWGPTAIAGTYHWSNAAYGDGRIYVVNFDGIVTAYDAATGAYQWSNKLPVQYAFSSPPTADGGMVYVGGAGSGGTLYALDGTTGAVAWSTSVQNGDDSAPTLSADAVFVSYACNQTYAFSRASGGLLWHNNGPCEGGGGKTTALFAGLLYTRDASDKNRVFDAVTGVASTTYASARIPAFQGGSAFLVSTSLTATSLATGAPTWTFAGDGKLVSAPLVVDGRVYVGSSTGTLFSVDAATGTMPWSDDVGSPIAAPDEQNVSQPLTGLGAGSGMLFVPAGSTLVAYGN
jgi:outer membrane protein assembly factor BamB